MLPCANLHTLHQECNNELVTSYLKASISACSSSSSGEVSLISLGMKVSAWLLGAELDPMRPRLTPPLVTGHLAVSCSDSAHTALHTGLETADSGVSCGLLGWHRHNSRVSDLRREVEDELGQPAAAEELADLVREVVAVECEEVPRARPDEESRVVNANSGADLT